MIICKKCHKAMKSSIADKFCNCCYPEPEEVPNEITLIGKLTPMMEEYFNIQNKIQTEINKQYQSISDYNRPRQRSENNEEQIIKLQSNDNSNDGKEHK